MNCEEKIKDLDVKLIKQEHRYIQAWINLFKFFFNKNLDSNDPRKNASLEAWLWVHFGPGTVATAGIGFISLFALYFSWQANDLLEQQNELINQDKKASYLPRLYIEPIDYQLTIPNKGSGESIMYKVDKDNGTEMFASANLPMRIANLGKGAAKHVSVNISYDLAEIIIYLNSIQDIHIEKNNGVISQIDYDGRNIHLLNRRNLPQIHYVLPLADQVIAPLLYLPHEYTALYSVYSWVKANGVESNDDNQKIEFPNLEVELSYFDIEEQQHFIKYEIEVFEDMRMWFAPQQDKKPKWVQLLKFRPAIKLQ
ncbi:hypothetical protein [Stutzerimonas nitrititolerans]|uniref:hypothetical protein n=1 Tax=Stutzerimonas nitrititolerans TaxID=2482751 RepID=UPI0015E38E7C|nr:hypothetical protein [Stutzerimonas nitrititolerans]MBA1183780.1 hypothetical protein [Stutzerimonas stutzeri]